MRLLPILFALFIACQSCSPKFSTPQARSNSVFFLRDSTEMRGELLALVDDSLFVLRNDLAETSAQRTIASFHYMSLEAAVFRNDAPEGLNAVGGLVGGALLGGVGGFLLGSLSDAGSSGNNRGWGALLGVVGGVPVGGLVGFFVGLVSGLDETVIVEDRQDLEELMPFVRFKDATELKNFRGY